MNHSTNNRPMNNIIYNRLLHGRMSFLEVCLLLMLPFLLLTSCETEINNTIGELRLENNTGQNIVVESNLIDDPTNFPGHVHLIEDTEHTYISRSVEFMGVLDEVPLEQWGNGMSFAWIRVYTYDSVGTRVLRKEWTYKDRESEGRSPFNRDYLQMIKIDVQIGNIEYKDLEYTFTILPKDIE